jgi:hypothetical protein
MTASDNSAGSTTDPTEEGEKSDACHQRDLLDIVCIQRLCYGCSQGSEHRPKNASFFCEEL